MSLTDYLIGLVCFAATVGSACATALIVSRRGLAHLRGAVRVLAFGLLATAAVILVHLVPGVLRILDRWTVLAMALLLVAGTWRFMPRGSPAEPDPAVPSVASDRRSWFFAIVGTAAVVVWVVAFLLEQGTSAPVSIDAAGFHLPNAVAWIQTRSMWTIRQFTTVGDQGYYPQNANVLLLATMLPWKNDFLVRSIYPLYIGMAAVGTYALALELRAPRAAAVLAGAVLISMPAVFLPALDASVVDIVMLGTFGPALVFLARWLRTDRTSDGVLAGLGLGLAFGTKWYGVTAAAIAIAVWAVMAYWRGRRLRPVVSGVGLLAGLTLASGGFWMVRNVVAVGDPVFPAKVAPLGVTIFDAPPDPYLDQLGFNLLHYADNAHVLRTYILPAFAQWWGLAGALIGVSWIAAAVLVLRRRRALTSRARATGIAVASAVALLALAYALTPFSAFGPEGKPYLTGVDTRYAGPALLVGLALFAWVVGRHRRFGRVLELAAFLAVFDGLWLVYQHNRWGIGGSQAVLALLAIAALAAVAAGVRALWLARRGRGFLLVGGLTTVLLAVAAGGALQARFNDNRYRGVDATYDWIRDHAKAGSRIGVAGDYVPDRPPIQPNFGPRFANEVIYLTHDDRGRFLPFTSGRAFAAALVRDKIDFVIIGRDAPPRTRVREENWASAAGFRPVARSPRFTLMRSESASIGD